MSEKGDDDEAELRRAAFDRMPVAAALEAGAHITAVNATFARFLGALPAEIVGRSAFALIEEFVLPHDRPLVAAVVDEQHTGRNPTGELWIQIKDGAGRIRPVRIEWHPSSRVGETVIYLLDAEREASARESAEGLARAAGQLVHCRDEAEVLDRAADVLAARGLVVTTVLLKEGDPLLEYGPMRFPAVPRGDGPSDEERLLRSARPRREILWELNEGFHQRRAAFFQDVVPLIHATYPGDVGERVLERVVERRTVQAPLFVNDLPYGAIVVTGDELNPVLTGSVEMFAELVARAIESVRLQRDLVERERLAALGEAAAVMAHEVRNPITAILNAGALLSKQAVEPASEAALLRVINEEAQRLDRLVGALLDLGRPLTPRVKSVDLLELAEQSVGVLGARGEARDVELVVTKGTSVLAAIDPDLTQLALWNVVRNAVQASPPGTRVTVTAIARGERSALVVDDAGPGFPLEQANRILEPFHTTRATGTGIGLAVVRRVVEACKGTIEIGASPGGGGRFWMVFPGAG